MSFRINPKASCLHILKNGDSKWDWVYTISPDKINSFGVYCDMTTDSGWWTLFYANNWFDNSPISESYVEMRTNVSTGQVYDLTDYDNPTLAWLLNYKYFTVNGATEVLIKNHVVTDDEDDKWWKIYFDKPETLEWALWDDVLWWWMEKCINIPEWATWWITSSSWMDTYKDLIQMYTNWWANWGISHLQYNCNWYMAESVLPHVAFYSANDNNFESRARSNMIIGWSWWWENEYRYFIR
jgi:hypothetical protein